MPAIASTLLLAGLTFPVLGDDFWGMIVSSRVGDVFAELLVSPDGEVDECTVLYTDLEADRSDDLCNQLRQKAVASPAFDQANAPVYGTVIFRFSTTLGRDAEPVVLQREPLLDIYVSALPAETPDQLIVGLRVLIDGQGRVEACEANTRPDDAYTRIACEQVRGMQHIMRHDRGRQPVRHVTDVSVAFLRS